MDVVNQAEVQPKKRLGCLWRLLRFAALLLFLALVFQEFFLDDVLERALRKRLATDGSPWDFEVRDASFRGFELRKLEQAEGLEAPHGTLSIERVRLDYADLFELHKGRLQQVTVQGATWRMQWEDGRLHLGLPDLPSSGEGTGLRIHKVELRDCHLQLQLGARFFSFLCQGQVLGVGSDRSEVRLQFRHGSESIDLAAQLPALDSSGPLRLYVSTAGRVRGTLPNELCMLPASVLEIRGDLDHGRLQNLRYSVAGKVIDRDTVLAGKAARVRGLRFSAEGELDPPGNLGSLAGTLAFEQVALGERMVDDGLVQFSLQERPRDWNSLAITVQGSGAASLPALESPTAFHLNGGVRAVLADPLPRLELEALRLDAPEFHLPRLGAFDLEGRMEGALDLSGTVSLDAVKLQGIIEAHGVRAEIFASDRGRVIRALDPEFEFPWSLRTQDGSLELALREPGKVVVGTLQRESASGAFYAGPFDFAIGGDAVLFFPLREEFTRGATGSFKLESTAPLRFESEDLKASFERLALVGDFDAAPGSARDPVLVATLEEGQALHVPTGLELRGIELVTPLPAPPGSEVSAGSLAVADLGTEFNRLDGFAGSLSWSAGELSHTARWQPTPHLALDLSAWVTRTGDAHLALASLPGAEVRAEDALGKLLEEFIDARVSAEIALESSLQRTGGKSSAAFTLAGRAGSLASMDDGHRFEGVELDASYVGPVTLAPAIETRLAWSGGRTGELALGRGEARALLDDFPYGVLVGAEAETACGSRFWSQGFRFGPRAPATTFQVFCEDVQLSEWLELTTPGRATGEGRLRGRIGFKLDPARSPALHPLEGYLASDGGGSLRIEDDESVDALLERSLGSLSLAEGVDLSKILRDRLVGALQDFAYESLNLRLVPGDEDLSLQAHAKGQGAVVPQELDLTVNFNGFGSLLEVLLDLDLVGAK